MNNARSACSHRTIDYLRRRHDEDTLHWILNDLDDAVEDASSCIDELEVLLDKMLPGFDRTWRMSCFDEMIPR